MKLLEIASNQKGNLELPVALFSRFGGPLRGTQDSEADAGLS